MGYLIEDDTPGAGGEPEAPAREANLRNNQHAVVEADRPVRWRSVRDALWALVEPELPEGGRILIAGAGHCHDVPLTRIAARASHVTLVDLDREAAEAARAREPEELAARIEVVEEDVTGGMADEVVAAAVAWRGIRELPEPPATIHGGGYDVAVGDMLYSQLLFPGLLHTGVPVPERSRLVFLYGPQISERLVRRLHASAPVVVHVHDVACWTKGEGQPWSLEEVLEDFDGRVSDLTIADGCDPSDELEKVGATVREVRHWHWPYGSAVDYVVRAVVADSPAE